MSKIKLFFVLLLLMSTTLSTWNLSFAGNGNRAGQAGATELLINPWARSSGWAGANSGTVRGLEASYLNIAGIAFTSKTELAFTNTSWLNGSGININAFGFTQRVGEAGVMGFNILSMSFGDIPITTVDLPEGGIGKFSPQYMNLGLSYAKAFSNSIYGGLNVKVISESISNVTANGVAFDAGIQYVTGTGKNKDGKKNTDNLKFGISLKNVGPSMSFNGDGLSFRGTIPSSNMSLTVEQRSEKFEIPSLINIGAAYDYKVSDMHRFTFATTFTSNSFTADQYLLGCEYGFKSLFMVRAGYLYEQQRTTALTGLCAGATIEVPLGKGGKMLGLDYSFRETYNFHGTHSIGVRINL